jgi:hypothetical protein
VFNERLRHAQQLRSLTARRSVAAWLGTRTFGVFHVGEDSFAVLDAKTLQR